uniref:Uncharacterized protein n=1 Tax=Avena sativa TaxID=4498 RepID=A0ACD5W2P3_AVESA
MVSAKRLAQLAKKSQRMAALGRKRLTATAKGDEKCCTSAVVKGRCIMYTADGMRFEVPFVYLSTMVFGELQKISQKFGIKSDCKITLPSDTGVMAYVTCLLRRNVSAEVENALLSSMLTSCYYTGCARLTVGSS